MARSLVSIFLLPSGPTSYLQLIDPRGEPRYFSRVGPGSGFGGDAMSARASKRAKTNEAPSASEPEAEEDDAWIFRCDSGLSNADIRAAMGLENDAPVPCIYPIYISTMACNTVSS